jgi:hypothetical protein
MMGDRRSSEHHFERTVSKAVAVLQKFRTEGSDRYSQPDGGLKLEHARMAAIGCR